VSTKSLSSLVVTALLCSVLPARSQSQLPEGNGKEAVQTLCGTCHSLKTVTDADGFTQEGWRYMLDIMINLGAQLPQDQIPVLTEYLAKNFPEKTDAAGGSDSGERGGLHKGVDCADTRFAAS